MPNSPTFFCDQEESRLLEAILRQPHEVVSILEHLEDQALITALTEHDSAGQSALALAIQKHMPLLPVMLNKMRHIEPDQQAQVFKEITPDGANALILFILTPQRKRRGEYQAVWNSLMNMMRNFSPSDLTELVTQQNSEGSILYFTAVHSIKKFNDIVQLLQKKLAPETLRRILKQAMNNSWILLENVKLPLDVEEIVLTKFKQDEAQRLLSYAIKHQHPLLENIFLEMEILIGDTWAEIFSQETQKGFNLMQLAIKTGHEKTAEYVFNVLKTHVTDAQLYNILFANENTHSSLRLTILQCPKFLKILFYAFVSDGTTHIDKNILRAMLINGMRSHNTSLALHADFNEVIDILDTYYDPSEFSDILLWGDAGEDYNLLSYAIDAIEPSENAPLMIERILEIIQKMPLPKQAELYGHACKSRKTNELGCALELALSSQHCKSIPDRIASAMEAPELESYLNQITLDALKSYHQQSKCGSCVVL